MLLNFIGECIYSQFRDVVMTCSLQLIRNKCILVNFIMLYLPYVELKFLAQASCISCYSCRFVIWFSDNLMAILMQFWQVEVEFSRQRHDGDLQEKNRLSYMLENKVRENLLFDSCTCVFLGAFLYSSMSTLKESTGKGRQHNLSLIHIWRCRRRG